MNNKVSIILIITSLVLGFVLGYFIFIFSLDEVVARRTLENYDQITKSRGQSELDLCKEIVYRTQVDQGTCKDLCDSGCIGDPEWCKKKCPMLCDDLPA